MLKITPHMFFDRQAVTRAAGRAKHAVLSKAGAFVRQRARTLIRPRKRIARPGEPPSSHTGLLRRLIWFGYDPRNGRERDTVVIGPAPLNQRSPYGTTTVPEVLEFGGTVTAKDRGKRVTRRYRGHPYMGPAMEAEQDKFAHLWRGSVRR